jgi:hypothetical protein
MTAIEAMLDPSGWITTIARVAIEGFVETTCEATRAFNRSPARCTPWMELERVWASLV